MKENICFLCDREFVFEKWYGKCNHCKILRPETKERMLEEMNYVLDLRTELCEHLHNLEQKYTSSPEEITVREMEERNIWIEHDKLHIEIMLFMKNYDIKNIRFEELYPRFYSYVKIAEKIKQMYK